MPLSNDAQRDTFWRQDRSAADAPLDDAVDDGASIQDAERPADGLSDVPESYAPEPDAFEPTDALEPEAVEPEVPVVDEPSSQARVVRKRVVRLTEGPSHDNAADSAPEDAPARQEPRVWEVDRAHAQQPNLQQERAMRQRAKQQQRRQTMAMVLRTVLLMLVALAVGVIVGIFVQPLIPVPGGSEHSLYGVVTVTEDELDSPLGTYAYEDERTVVTVREAIEETSTLEAVRNADGTYDMPSVDAVLSIARNHFLALDAQEHGIQASDEDMLAYAREVWKTDDIAVIAANYGMDVDRVKERLKAAATVKLLRDSVVTTEPMSEPEEPVAPSDGNADDMRSEYATYIMDLVGDEWDANANSWRREDGPFYKQLKDYTISNDEATYAAAQAAYYVARTQYAAVEQQIASEWTAYVNQILSKVTVELGSLVA